MKKINNYLIILCIITYLIPFNWAINVGIGISDVTGPAAEIGMVRNNYIFCYQGIIISMKVQAKVQIGGIY